ncbi:MAG: zinc ribbon domain-containing protein, partial [Methanoregula sp.]|nr:zinc ribbon domain-containing protein [Methanoregula sp.]
MVQFCPKCGTKDPDDQAVFCNTCGNRLPPRVPERRGIICPACGMKNADPEAVYCNRCGSPLLAPPPAPVRRVAARPATAPPVMAKERCPSCGAPFVDAVSDYCNVCGAHLHGPAPSATVPEPPRPSPAKSGAPPVMAKERCPSCGAPLVDEKSDYCNVCGY